MEKIIKYSNYFGLVLALCTMVISGCSYSTSKKILNPQVRNWQQKLLYLKIQIA